MKWNESGFRPPLCTYRLNWARRTSWGWWDDWDDTVLQTQDSKFEPWRSEAEHATSRSLRLPTILTFTRGWGRNIFVSFKPPRPGTEPPNGVKGSGANHYPRAPALIVMRTGGLWTRLGVLNHITTSPPHISFLFTGKEKKNIQGLFIPPTRCCAKFLLLVFQTEFTIGFRTLANKANLDNNSARNYELYYSQIR